ncbi:bifunctional demethylmenaquinone methyltransferase/2-methoxy-6-polyprenyl-1,4-benzoquinol methylase UbiE [Deltaproteobacteria bacterium]|nr:bifunctional demethylmenaquinone methyltransferase/2-methoxy-6-polyprenyl-1,4-benzoquinol methylase UbiE [Deltaproteobacteria bacterium]
MTYTLPNTEEKSVYVEQMFNKIAQKYDLFNDIITFGMHRHWKKFVVRQTDLQAEQVCLDLCCGTGDIAREVLRQYPSSKVTGLDFSEEMLNIAESKNTSEIDVKYVPGDAMNIPFQDAVFDAVTIGYGMRNVQNINKFLREILRVLKPEGVLVSLDVGKVRKPILAKLNHFYFFHIVPFIGKLLMPGEEIFKYLPESSNEYPNQDSLKNLIIEAGFEKVEFHNFVFGASAVHVAYKPAKN